MLNECRKLSRFSANASRTVDDFVLRELCDLFCSVVVKLFVVMHDVSNDMQNDMSFYGRWVKIKFDI